MNMLLETVSLDWIQDRRFELRDRNGYAVIMDQPEGVNASDLLPLSLIGCSAYDVIAILQKQRQEVVDLTISAQSTRDAEPPWRFRKIHIQYKVSGRALDPEKVQRALHLAEDKYCGVYATLRDVVEITNDFEIVEV
jgi:putative redox protein